MDMDGAYEGLIGLVRGWGERLVEHAGKVADIGVRKRWLTEFDLAIERDIAAYVHALPGEHTLFAEEEHDIPRQSSNQWIVDPISSTRNFVRGLPLFSTVVSHVVEGETRFALVYDPSRRELFTARRGQGAFLNGERIFVERPSDDLFLHFMPAHRSFDRSRAVDAYDKLLQLGSVRTTGMSEGLQYAYVACGRFSGCASANIDVFPAWAGRLLVEEAGGVFTDFFGNALAYQPHGTLSGAREVHARLLETMRGFTY